MLRTIEIILLVLTVLLFITAFIACNNNSTKLQNNSSQQLSAAFHCTVNATLNGTTYETTLAKQGTGIYTLSFTKPSTLSSLSFALTSEGMKVKFGDIVASVDPSSIPQTALVNAMLDAFDAASAKTGVAAKLSGKDTILSGHTQAGDFVMTLNPDYTPKSLKIPSIDLNALFKNFQYDK